MVAVEYIGSKGSKVWGDILFKGNKKYDFRKVAEVEDEVAAEILQFKSVFIEYKPKKKRKNSRGKGKK